MLFWRSASRRLPAAQAAFVDAHGGEARRGGFVTRGPGHAANKTIDIRLAVLLGLAHGAARAGDEGVDYLLFFRCRGPICHPLPAHNA
jgi:hypothetical protein